MNKKYYALSDVCLRITDGSHFSPKEDASGQYPMLSVKDMMAAGFDYSNCKYINEADYATLVANGCRPSINDVLVAKDGSYLKTAFVQTKDIEQAILSSIAILTPNIEIINPFYLACFFKAPHTKAVVEKHYLTGTAIKRVILKGFKQIRIPMPALPEQERIVAELDLLTGIIDKQKAQLKELDTLAQSIFYNMFGDPSTNEKGWTMSTFKDSIRLKSGDGLSEKQFQIGNFPVYGGNGISGYHNTFNKDGDFIIIGRVGAYCGNVRYVRGRFWLTDNAFQAYFDTNRFNYRFLCFLLNTINLHQYANQAAQPVISNVGLKDIVIILPPLSLQESFAQKIQSIESQKESINRSITETQKLFDYTMDKYFG